MKELQYVLTDQMVAMIADIAELIGKLSSTGFFSPDVSCLHKNRLLQVYGSLKLDNSTLSLAQIAGFMDGKRVKIPMGKDDVEGAAGIYGFLNELDPYKVEDLLTAHRIMMHTQAAAMCGFRKCPSRVNYDQAQTAFSEATPEEIPQLVANLLFWAQGSDAHPLLKSCVVHCELMLIRPFYDGNGRISRFWQTLILSKYKDAFAWLPVEAYVNEHRDEYLQSIAKAQSDGLKTDFIIYMLAAIKTALKLAWSREAESAGLTAKEAERWSQIQDYLTIHGNISNANVRSMFHVSSATANRILTLYHKKRLLERVFISNHVGYIQGKHQP